MNIKYSNSINPKFFKEETVYKFNNNIKKYELQLFF